MKTLSKRIYFLCGDYVVRGYARINEMIADYRAGLLEDYDMEELAEAMDYVDIEPDDTPEKIIGKVLAIHDGWFSIHPITKTEYEFLKTFKRY